MKELLTPRQKKLSGGVHRSGARQQRRRLLDREAVEERVDEHEGLGDADDEQAFLLRARACERTRESHRERGEREREKWIERERGRERERVERESVFFSFLSLFFSGALELHLDLDRFRKREKNERNSPRRVRLGPARKSRST